MNFKEGMEGGRRQLSSFPPIFPPVAPSLISNSPTLIVTPSPSISLLTSAKSASVRVHVLGLEDSIITFIIVWELVESGKIIYSSNMYRNDVEGEGNLG